MFELISILAILCLVICLLGLGWAYQRLLVKYTGVEKDLSFYKTGKQNMLDTFKQTAGEILEQGSQKFSNHSKLVLDNLLNPLKQEITSFRQKTENMHKDAGENHSALDKHIKLLHDAVNKVDNTADTLGRALTGSSKVRGDWGETSLERILEETGFKEGIDYKKQVSVKDSEGKSLRPDFVVYMPKDRAIVIDAKLNLVHWYEYTKAIDSSSDQFDAKLAADLLKEHVADMKDSIKDLAQKSYAELMDGHQLDMVLMFVPIEAAFVAALAHTPNLMHDALEKRVSLVSQTTLLSVLHLIRFLWRAEDQSKNAEEIAQQGKKICEKIENFKKNMDDVGTNLERATASWEKSYKQLSQGSGNLLSQADKLQSLGVSSKKLN